MSIYYVPGATPVEYIYPWQPFSVGEYNYGAGFDCSVIPGAILIIETPRPTDKTVNVVGWHHAPDGTQVWDTVPKSPEQIAAEKRALSAALEVHVRNYLNTTAQSFGYDDIMTAISYANDPTRPDWQAEGITLRNYRTACWDAAYAHIAETDEPTEETVLDSLPALSTVAGADAYRAMILRRADALEASDPLAAEKLRQSVS
jgi:hypothetical protein